MPDIEIRLGGGVYRLRPTFGAMREIEAKCGSSCRTLLSLLAKGEMQASEKALVIYHGLIEAGESATDPEAVGKRLFELGIDTPAVCEPVADYLAELLYAPDSARKKAVGEWFREVQSITSLMFSAQPMQSDGDLETFGDPLPENSGPSSRPSVKNPSKSADSNPQAE